MKATTPKRTALLPLLERHAPTSADARFVLGVMRKRAAGATRQQTTAEIMAKYYGWSAEQTAEALGK